MAVTMVIARMISYILTALSVLLHLVVHMSPGWTARRLNTSPNLVGLWTICSNEWGCNPSDMDTADINTVRGFMATALALSFIALVWTVEWDRIFHCGIARVPKALATAFFNFLAGICVFVALLVFGLKVTKKTVEVPPNMRWAFYLSIIICILSFSTAILDVVFYKYKLWGIGQPNFRLTSEQAKAVQIEKQNAKIPRLL